MLHCCTHTQLLSMETILLTSHNTGHTSTHLHWNTLHFIVNPHPVSHLCYRSHPAHTTCAKRSSTEVQSILVAGIIACDSIASSGGTHGSQKGSVVHEKAPTQRSHEPTPASLLASRKSIPIPGLHARVQRESRTKVCLIH